MHRLLTDVSYVLTDDRTTREHKTVGTDITHFEACIMVCATCGITLAVCSFYIASVILFTAALFLSIVYAFWVYDGSLVHNISNHETWIVVCFSNALVLAIVGGTT